MIFPLKVLKGIEIIQSQGLADFPELVHAFSTRNGGVSAGLFRSLNLGIADGDTLKNILINRKRFCNTLNFAPSDIAQAEQLHSNQVTIVEMSGPYQDCDALITDKPHIFLSIKTADCAPVLLYDPNQRIVGAIHAGWRGTTEGIIANTVATMQTVFNSKSADLIAAIGPALHACCYEVQEDVAGRFKDAEIIRRNGHLYLDLIAAVTNRLIEIGLQPARIADSEYCTACHPEKFYSYRRDGERTGRMWAVIGIDHRNRG